MYKVEVQISDRYRLVRLANGAHSVHSLVHHETFHPVVGPLAEADALYVRQLRLVERLKSSSHGLTVWDIGLGAAANVIMFLKAAQQIESRVKIVSFDATLEPLQFAVQNAEALCYVRGYEDNLTQLLQKRSVTFTDGSLAVHWTIHAGDFPTLLKSPDAELWDKPDAIMFDAFSPATNPEMWTQPLFARIFALLDPERPCALPTYSRSTMLRCTLLLAGFYVGVGHPTGEKEETTIAANSLALIDEPLDTRWLARVKRSSSAEPMWEPQYRQAPLSPGAMARLQEHPQFR